MKQDEEQELIRHYLLGELAHEEQERLLEERLLTDDSCFEELLIAEDDLIDGYLSGALTKKEKDGFEHHFLATAERRRKLRFAAALRKYVSERSEVEAGATVKTRRPHWLSSTAAFFSSPLRVAASILILLAVGLGLWRVFLYQSDVNKGLLALKTAYREQRPTEARITELDYAPLPQTRGNESGKIDNQSRERAQRLLLDAVRDSPGASSFHALGRFYLAELRFDQAIEQFKKALATNERDAQLQSDLGAALLEKGKLDALDGGAGKSLEEFAESLTHLNRAIELNDSQLEALFNRALCYQYLMLPGQAADDWRKYLEKDSASPWADEARRNLSLIESQKNRTSRSKEQLLQDYLAAYQARDDDAAWQIISLHRNYTGSLIVNALVDNYLELRAGAREAEAKANLGALSYAGELELTRANDHFVSDLVRFYGAATVPQQASLVEARRLMKAGHEQLQLSKPEAAAASYNEAKQIFDRAGDESESLYIDYPLGQAYLLLHKSELGLSVFRRVADAYENHQYRWLLARALDGMGNAQIGLNDYSSAIESSTRSREISAQINDAGGMMKIADQLALEYTRLGNYAKAIEQEQRGLALFPKNSPDAQQIWRSYFLMATPLSLLGLNAAAASFQKEALRVATEAHLSPYYTCRSYIGLGLIYGSQRKFEEATSSVRLAFEQAQNIPSEATRVDTLAYAALQLGNLYRQAGDFERAVESYEQVIQASDESGYQAFSYAAHKGKLLACIAQGGGCSSAEQDIETTLELFENHRSKILEEENRFSFFDAEQNVYDVAIDFKYSIKHNSQTAFEFSERSRARSLLDLTSMETRASDTYSEHASARTPAAVVSQPMSLPEIRERMPVEAQILQYSLLDKKLLIWLVSREGVSAFEQSLDTDALREKVSNYLQLISSPPVDNEEAVKGASAELYDLLIKPVEAALDKNRLLCIVPDKVLNYLPYGALLSRTTGKYLAQEFTLTLSPSSNIFIICSENARRKEGASAEKLLSVGNPTFDHRAFPSLADLPSAKREAEEVAAYYNSAPAITGERASKSRVLGEIERADVIHLALHSVVNEPSPLRSKLLLARQSGAEGEAAAGEGVLEASEIYKLRLPRARVVVLSACQTGAERYYGGEGMISISRPFIAVGVPLVVASLWPVNSDATEELMVNFHKHRKQQGLSTAEALRLAQQEMLGNTKSPYRQPYYWASFTPIGGYARF